MVLHEISYSKKGVLVYERGWSEIVMRGGGERWRPIFGVPIATEQITSNLALASCFMVF